MDEEKIQALADRTGVDPSVCAHWLEGHDVPVVLRAKLESARAELGLERKTLEPVS